MDYADYIVARNISGQFQFLFQCIGRPNVHQCLNSFFVVDLYKPNSAKLSYNVELEVLIISTVEPEKESLVFTATIWGILSQNTVRMNARKLVTRLKRQQYFRAVSISGSVYWPTMCTDGHQFWGISSQNPVQMNACKLVTHLKVLIITGLGQRQKSAYNAENTTYLSETLQVPSLCCFS